MVDNLLEFAEYRKWRSAEYPRLKALETRHHPPPTRGEKRMRKASVIRVINFIYQLHDFIIFCVTEICQVTWLHVLSAVNYTTFESLYTCAVSEAFQLKSAAFRDPWQRRKFSGIRASQGDVFCFLLTDFCWPFQYWRWLDRFPVKVFYRSRQINAWTRSLVNAKLQHLLKSMGWKVAKKRKIQWI